MGATQIVLLLERLQENKYALLLNLRANLTDAITRWDLEVEVSYREPGVREYNWPTPTLPRPAWA